LRTFSSLKDPKEKPTIKQASLKVSLKNERLKLDSAFYGNFENPVLKFEFFIFKRKPLPGAFLKIY